MLWLGCILVISGRCIYGPWISWQPPRCDAPLINPVETYMADIATALGPPAAVLLLHRLVMWWSWRVPAQPIIDLAAGRYASRSRDGRVNNQGAMLARLPEWLNLNGRGAER